MYCRKCGTNMPDEALFCPKCGTKVESGALKTSVTAAETTAPESTTQSPSADQTLPAPKNAVDFLKKHLLKIIAATSFFILLIAGLTINALMVRNSELAKFDKKAAKIYSKFDKLTDKRRAMEARYNLNNKNLFQKENESIDFKSQVDAVEAKREELNKQVDELDRTVEDLNKYPYATDPGRANALTREYNNIGDQYNNLRTTANSSHDELDNLFSGYSSLKGGTDSSMDEIKEVRDNINNDYQRMSKQIKYIKKTRKSLSIYSFSFYDSLRKIENKTRNIDFDPVENNIDDFYFKIPGLEDKLASLSQHIDRFKVVYQGLADTVSNMSNLNNRGQAINNELRGLVTR